MQETAAVPGIYRLMLLTFLVSLTLFLMPTMVSNAINQAFSSVASSDFPTAVYPGVCRLLTDGAGRAGD
ncbi:hypothetical protein [Citrobacter amalonaticus]|uniref:hypothetical protein n=1 Tax=Citrobacter amalonaticus TaxID=35703 RepID=UPI001CE41CA2|nr:hypothetical protein [Citrobacter amalonaticus]